MISGEKFILLPGMGADERMYPRPWTELPNVQFVRWPLWNGESSISQVAERLAAGSDFEPGAWLIGSSLGGMVACELASLVYARGLILVGSAISSVEINLLLSKLAPLAQITPISMLQAAAGKLPNELMQMFRNADPRFVRAMCQAIATWHGARILPKAFLRIHGSRDLVIPPPNLPHVAIAGGHLIAMTHAHECVAAVREFVTTQLRSRNEPNSGSNSRR